MRRLLALILVLTLVPSVYAACSGSAPNGIVEGNEECDDGNLVDGDGCSNACFAEQESNYALFDLLIGHNMLFSKVMDLLHVVKHAIFQLELKIIEIQLTDYSCDQQPVSFWMPSSLSPYGKLEEVDGMIELLVQSLDDGIANGANFGSVDTAGATTLLTEADECIADEEYRQAFECKCLAYRVELLGLTDTSVTCSDPCGGGD